MKKQLSVTICAALAFGAGSAFAADLPSRKAPPVYVAPEPLPLWTGPYAGVNVGGEWGDGGLTAVPGTIYVKPASQDGCPNGPLTAPCAAFDHGSVAAAAAAVLGGGKSGGNNGGFLGGGQIGYNYQFGAIVAGIEADIQGLTGGNSSSSRNGVAAGPTFAYYGNPNTPNTVTAYYPTTYLGSSNGGSSVDWLGTVRGRIGYLVTPTLLLYGTGGLAYGGVSGNLSTFGTLSGLPGFFGPVFAPFYGSASLSGTRVGWTAGGGVEWLFLPNWSAKVEYLYYDLGTATGSFTYAQHGNVGGPVYVNNVLVSSHFYGNIVRAGVNYHLNWFAPAAVLAKY